ncbi:MAG: hypothetical protein P4L53_16415 [Candidatus Obscuribacterales bacterium]|nr:hypothetical protein [Candidatus Obscuribacterales bacterium]
MSLSAIYPKVPKAGLVVRFLVLLTFLSLANVDLTQAKAPKGKTTKNSGWVLDANSNFAGTVSFQFDEEAARFHLDKMGLTMITKAPSWDVILYNEVNKNCLTMTYTKWQQRFKSTVNRHTAGATYTELPVEISKHSEKILGFATDKYTLRKVSQKTHQSSKTECWVANEVQVPPHFAGILHILFQAPENIKGMPMRVEIPANGRQVPAIEVYKLQPKTFSGDEFKPLTGYKKVKDEMALMLDDNDEMGAAMLGPEPDKKAH